MHDAAGSERQPDAAQPGGPPKLPAPASAWSAWIRSRRGRRRIRHIAISALLGVAAATTVVIVCAALLVRGFPAWWRTVRLGDPATVAVATAVEDGISTLLTSSRPPVPGAAVSEPWTVAIRAGDANAWLNTRLPKWLANMGEPATWPANVSEVQVEFHGGTIAVGVRVHDGGSGGDQVLSARLVPTIAADGSLWMPARTISIGRLPIPAAWVLSGGLPYARDHVPGDLLDLPETQRILRAFAGTFPVARNASLRLADGRRVRLLHLTADGGRLLITCRTEWP